MIGIRRLLLTATMVVAGTSLAGAAQIVQTFSLPSSGGNGTSWTSSSSIYQFNTSLGTLEYIEVIANLSTTVNAGTVDANQTPGTGRTVMWLVVRQV